MDRSQPTGDRKDWSDTNGFLVPHDEFIDSLMPYPESCFVRHESWCGAKAGLAGKNGR